MSEGGSHRRVSGWWWPAAVLFFGFFAHGYVENTDSLASMHAARAFARRGDLGLNAAGADTWAAERLIARQSSYGMSGVNGRHYLWFPVGHQLLLVPLVVAGDALTAVFPDPDERLRRDYGEELGDGFWPQLLISFVSPLAAAVAFVALLGLARALGASARESILVVAVATVGTQFWPGSSETMSDGAGAACLFLCALGVARYHAFPERVGVLIGAGLAGGLAVSMRYPHVVPVAVLTGCVAWLAWRRRQPAAFARFALGGLPFAVGLAIANQLRFGSLTETGYSAGATAEWFSYPMWIGLPMILLSPGRGLFWFSPPLWPAAAQLLRPSGRTAPVVVAAAMLIVPMLLSARTAGWAGGQCWGVRYLTAGTVLFVVVALTVGRPWTRRPRAFAAVAVLGVLVSLGGVLTPYVGQHAAALHASKSVYAADLAAGTITEADLHDRVNFNPRFSPLHTHWVYAALAATGRLDGDSPDEIGHALFGTGVPGPLPIWPRDRGFGHWWMVHLGRYVGLPTAAAAALWWIAFAYVVRRALRADGVRQRA